MTINEHILKTLLNSIDKLNDESIELIRKFVKSKQLPDGGFADRAGKSDPYYSLFGYSLAFALDIELDINKEKGFLSNWAKNNNADFIHAVSIIQCTLLLYAIKEKKAVIKSLSGKNIIFNTFSDLFKNKVASNIKKECESQFKTIENHKALNFGFNHTTANAKRGTTYGNYLIYSLYTDLNIIDSIDDISKGLLSLQFTDGSFMNDSFTTEGVTSSTSAGAILLKECGYKDYTKSIKWLTERLNNHGGFTAGENTPIADLLSSATALFTLKHCEYSDLNKLSECANFIDYHWDESGGFFGSIADMTPDVEYTYYGLLGLGCLL